MRKLLLFHKWKCRKCDAEGEWTVFIDALRKGKQHYRKWHKKTIPHIETIPSSFLYQDRNTLIRLYHGENYTMQEMADFFGITRETIARWMNLLEIPIRCESECAKMAMDTYFKKEKFKRWSGVEDTLNLQRKKQILALAGVIE